MKKQSEIIVRYLDENNLIELGHYQYGDNIAFMLIIADGEDKGMPMSTVSTNVDGYSFEEGEIAACLNNHQSEITKQLIDEKVLVDTGKRATSGFNTYAICKINFEVDKDYVS